MFTIQLNSIQTIKESIMTYFNGTLQEFTYLHEQVTEISNPDESYLGTLNLFFKNLLHQTMNKPISKNPMLLNNTLRITLTITLSNFKN